MIRQGAVAKGPRLYFPLYHGGMCNVLMSLDNAVALAHLSGRTLVPYNARPLDQGHYRPIVAGRDFDRQATVLDLFDVPVPVSFECYTQREIQVRAMRRLPCGDFSGSAFHVSGQTSGMPTWVYEFLNGRDPARLFSFDAPAARATALAIEAPTLAMHSYFLCLEPAARAGINRLLSRIEAKEPYRLLAKSIAAGIGRFNALHVRRGDFVHARFTPRVAQITPSEIIENTEVHFDRDTPLAILTDSPADTAFFGPILSYYRNAVLLDKMLLDEPAIRRRLSVLPFHDNAVLSLMAQLIATHAETFIGTLCSSYTAFIQRRRGFIRGDRRFLYAYNDFGAHVRYQDCQLQETRPGRFSWNRSPLPIAPRHYSWCREWPEVFDGLEFPAGARKSPELPPDT
jgi:hypothetical protein